MPGRLRVKVLEVSVPGGWMWEATIWDPTTNACGALARELGAVVSEKASTIEDAVKWACVAYQVKNGGAS